MSDPTSDDQAVSKQTKLAITADRFGGAPCPDAFNIARDIVAAGAERHPDALALMVVAGPESGDPISQMTYAELARAIEAMAGKLRAGGVTPGERVLIRLPNTPDYAFAVFACFAIGAVAVPLSDQLTDAELGWIVGDAEPATAVVTLGMASSALDCVPRHVVVGGEDHHGHDVAAHKGDFVYANTASDDPALLIYTSGTTARPKGVLHGHRMAWGRRPMAQGWYGLKRDDRLFHAGAFNWTFTLGTGLIDPWMAGATAVITTGPRSPDVWPALLRRTDATMFAAVPGLIRQILKYARPGLRDLPLLRHGLIAGDTPPAGLFDDWMEATGTPLYEALGMSEISTYISTGPDVPRKAGTLGKAQAGRAIAILPEQGLSTSPVARGEVGRLAVHRSDPGLMLGYWRREDEERDVFRGDWFIGGDLAAMDDDGYITHHGRDNDVMKPLGYRVSPLEVEAALLTHPDIVDAACAEVEIKDGVRVVAAFVVVDEEGRNAERHSLSADDVVIFAGERLAAYKCPRIVQFVDALPKTANGKLTRAKLSDLLRR
ncbi:MAG: class I adenylate-forming enzyme family protein [Pseudomonadota bacterium]